MEKELLNKNQEKETFDRLIVVAHGVNTEELLKRALVSATDLIEVDIWPQSRVAVHFGPFGLTGIGTSLDKLLDHQNRAYKGVILDLRCVRRLNREKTSQVVEQVVKNGYQKIAASSPDWETLTWLGENYPIGIYFSISNRKDLERFMDNLPKGGSNGDAGVSIRGSLLSQDLVQKLKSQKLKTLAWTVNDPKRARELYSWGVYAVTSDDFDLPFKLQSKIF